MTMAKYGGEKAMSEEKFTDASVESAHTPIQKDNRELESSRRAVMLKSIVTAGLASML